MDPNEFIVFQKWLGDLSHENHPYLLKVLEEDIKPCLSFTNKEVEFAYQLLLHSWILVSSVICRVAGSYQKQ